MKNLSSDWKKLASRIKKSRNVFLFFDYDGTLTPIVSRPEKAKFPRRVKDLIKKLHKNTKFTIAIISGRSLKNVKKMVGLKGIIYAGNHGMEIETGKGKFLSPVNVSSVRPVIKKIYGSLRKEIGSISGVIIEDKGATLSVHYRLVSLGIGWLVKRKFDGVVKRFVSEGKIKITRGKKVLEVRPNLKWDKGRAVKLLLKGKKATLPIYFGDDVTDEDAFRAIRRIGISVFVGRPSARGIKADYFLRDPKDVEKFIKKLL